MKKAFFTLISMALCLGMNAQNSCGLQVTGAVTNVRCQGQSNGAISVTITGGSGTYSYYWVSGADIIHTKDLSNVPAGGYTIYVQDANNPGCSTFQYFEVTEPDPLEISWLSKASYNGMDLRCNNSNDGQVSVSAFGGTTPYQYSLNNSSFQSSNTFSNLPAGTYYATVKDQNGCLVTNDQNSSLPHSTTWIAPAAVLTAPARLVTDSIQVTPTTVLSTGAEMYTIYLGYALQSLGLTAGNTTGGTGMYSYNWSPTTGLANWDVASVLATPTVTTTYTVTITDGNGCSVSRSVTINVINVTSSDGSSKKTIVCHNGNTISVSNESVDTHLKHGDHLGPCHNSYSVARHDAENLSTSESEILIAPNPAHGRFSVNTGTHKQGRIEVFNSAGVLVITKNINATMGSLQSFNIEGMAPGVYYVKLSGSGENSISKLVVQ
jgi:hypothetical protein